MKLEQLLAECIDAIEQGATLADCLTAHPAEAQALEPLLRLALQLRQTAPPRLSDRAFARGRAGVTTQARVQQSLRPSRQTFHRQPPSQPLPQPEPWQPRRKPTRLPTPRHASHWFVDSLGASMRLLLVCVLLLSGLTFLRATINSLPGATLHPLKISFEQMEGLLLAAAGESAVWHRQQVERRLVELAQLARLHLTPEVAYLQTVEDEVQSTLEATASMTPDERSRFLTVWLEELTDIQATVSLPAAAVPTLRRVVIEVQAAIAQMEQPIVAATATATATLTPTVLQPTEVIATPTPLLQPTKTPIVQATVTLITDAVTLESVTLPLATVTRNIALQTPTATATPMPVRTLAIPQESKPSSSQDDSDKQNTAGGTIPQPTVNVVVENPIVTTPSIGEAAVLTGTQNSGGNSNHGSPEVTATPETANDTITPEGGETPLSTETIQIGAATSQPGATSTAATPPQAAQTITPPATPAAATLTTATEQSVPTTTGSGKATATPVVSNTPRPTSENEEEDNNGSDNDPSKATEVPTEPPPPTVGATATTGAKPTNTLPPAAPPAPTSTPRPEGSRTPNPEKTATPGGTTAATSTPKATAAPTKSTEGATKTPSP